MVKKRRQSEVEAIVRNGGQRGKGGKVKAKAKTCLSRAGPPGSRLSLDAEYVINLSLSGQHQPAATPKGQNLPAMDENDSFVGVERVTAYINNLTPEDRARGGVLQSGTASWLVEGNAAEKIYKEGNACPSGSSGASG